MKRPPCALKRDYLDEAAAHRAAEMTNKLRRRDDEHTGRDELVTYRCGRHYHVAARWQVRL